MAGRAVQHPGGPAAVLCERITALQQVSAEPVLVALDGRSGAGKSTLARRVGEQLGAVVIDGDDFYRGGTDAFWDALGPAEKVDLVIDWERQRSLLTRLRQGEAVTWRPYDWDADDGGLGAPITAGPAAVVLLDGAYSARPSWRPSSANGCCSTSSAPPAGSASCNGKGSATGPSGRRAGVRPKISISTS